MLEPKNAPRVFPPRFLFLLNKSSAESTKNVPRLVLPKISLESSNLFILLKEEGLGLPVNSISSESLKPPTLLKVGLRVPPVKITSSESRNRLILFRGVCCLNLLVLKITSSESLKRLRLFKEGLLKKFSLESSSKESPN